MPLVLTLIADLAAVCSAFASAVFLMLKINDIYKHVRTVL